jgi:hypothetical protein
MHCRMKKEDIKNKNKNTKTPKNRISNLDDKIFTGSWFYQSLLKEFVKVQIS